MDPAITAKCSAGLLLQDVDGAGGAEADDVGEADRGALDLTIAGLAPQVGGDLVDVGGAGGADRVALGDEAAADVDGGLAVAPRRAGVDEGARPTRLAQPEVVVVDELGRGEAVVELDQVE